jgi:hypothetical protein
LPLLAFPLLLFPAAGPAALAAADVPGTAKQDAAEIDALVQAWLAAQNQGKLDAYQVLYAQKFQGIRRSGPRVRRFDRAGWLADRERMFRKPMSVALDDRKISAVGAAWNLVATQSWSSGSYKDKGNKRFLLVREGGRLVIAQEEMLASTIDRPPRALDGECLLVYQGDPVVTDAADDTWADRRPLRLDGFSARSGVDVKALPDEIRRWRGRDLVLLDPAGHRCDAKVKGFAIVSGADWHFGTIQNWQEGHVSKAAMAEQIWKEGAHRLVLTLERAAGGEGKVCDGAVLAVVASKAPARVYPFVSLAGTPPENLVLKATRKRLLDSVKGQVEELDGEEFHLVAFEDDARTRGIVFSHHYPHECTPVSGSASGAYLWRFDDKAKGRLSLLTTLEADEAIPSTPHFAVDLDGDGVLEIVYAGAYSHVAGLLQRSGDGYQVVRSVEVPFYDCGC